MTQINTDSLQHLIEHCEVVYPQSTSVWTAPNSRSQQYLQAVLLNHGEAELVLNCDQLKVQSPQIIWVPTAALKRISFSAGSKATLVSIKEDWMLDVLSTLNNSDVNFRGIAETYHSCQIPENMSIRFQHCFDMIKSELVENLNGARSVLSSQISTVLSYVNRLDQVTICAADQQLSSTISQRFLQLVELHYHDHWRVSDYANELGVTERRLELVLQRDFNEPPISLLHRKLRKEACHLLEFTATSISEIAYRLGYRDPSYFNKFFKRLTGSTPGVWRQKSKDEKDRLDVTYAAWP